MKFYINMIKAAIFAIFTQTSTHYASRTVHSAKIQKNWNEFYYIWQHSEIQTLGTFRQFYNAVIFRIFIYVLQGNIASVLFFCRNLGNWKIIKIKILVLVLQKLILFDSFWLSCFIREFATIWSLFDFQRVRARKVAHDDIFLISI